MSRVQWLYIDLSYPQSKVDRTAPHESKTETPQSHVLIHPLVDIDYRPSTSRIHIVATRFCAGPGGRLRCRPFIVLDIHLAATQIRAGFRRLLVRLAVRHHQHPSHRYANLSQRLLA